MGNANKEGLSFNDYELPNSMKVIMASLKLTPWICGVGFGASFFVLLAHQFGNGPDGLSFLQGIDGFYLAHAATINAINIICVSGLIGFGTNFLAIRMLFRPVERRPIWGQGLIPAQRTRIIFSLAKGMHTHILNQELIRKRVEETGLVKKVNDLLMDGSSGMVMDDQLREELKSTIYQSMVDFSGREDIRKDIRQMIDVRLEENLDGGVKKLVLQTYKRFNKDDYESAIDKIIEDLPKIVQEVMIKLESQLDTVAAYIRKQKKFTEEQIMMIFVDLLNKIDITTLLAKQMEHFDEAKLERMVWEATNEQLLYIQYLGTILGIFGGLLIWRPGMMGGVYLLSFLVLFGVDQLLYRWKKKKSELSE